MYDDATTNRYEQFRQAATSQGIPNDEISKFADQLRFAVWLGGAGSDQEVVGQAGGLPRLPVGTEWPTDGNGYALPFIASVDCAALPRVEGLPLPTDGSLLLFLQYEEDSLEPFSPDEQPEYARLLYVPAGAETVVAPLPPELDGMDVYGMPLLIPEYELSAWVEADLPEWMEETDESDMELQPGYVRQLFNDLKHFDQLCEIVDSLWPGPGRRMSTLRIGGHCMEIGGSDGPWHQMAVANLKNRPEAGLDRAETWNFPLIQAEEHRLIREWVPLAQFYTQSDVHYGCFLISFEDLAAKRFDKMRSFTMFSE
ncbi:DUF1963 domain-containing protein [Saccharothrix syringae]|uniref:DUF1963 domain-containing protein n=1 Tax=Saccharothrix syringae TaxID=103733 RepID=A0A5Q0GUV8_SACSY|nr:DUF1963 domain-containing protein [Saccharothrix syringae]QFZ17749.1 DUF1963 domain-containing protein [Saccharothrix syringae]